MKNCFRASFRGGLGTTFTLPVLSANRVNAGVWPRTSNELSSQCRNLHRLPWRQPLNVFQPGHLGLNVARCSIRAWSSESLPSPCPTTNLESSGSIPLEAMTTATAKLHCETWQVHGGCNSSLIDNATYLLHSIYAQWKAPSPIHSAQAINRKMWRAQSLFHVKLKQDNDVYVC